MFGTITKTIAKIRGHRQSIFRAASRGSARLHLASMEVRLVPAEMVMTPSLPFPVVDSSGAVIKTRDNQVEMAFPMFSGMYGTGIDTEVQWLNSLAHVPGGPSTPPPWSPNLPPPPSMNIVKDGIFVVGQSTGAQWIPTSALASMAEVIVPSPIPVSPWSAPLF